ncbi:MAG: UbiA family prenyltransferase [Flavobacterium sp.]
MWSKLIKFIFFANYFIGILAIALSLEAVIQLRLPFNSPVYYLLLLCATVFYYTYAYTIIPASNIHVNPRTEWYKTHRFFIKTSQIVLLSVCIVACLFIAGSNYKNIIALPLPYWITIFIIGLSAILYYGLLPFSSFKLNLRNTGWIKAFVIGFVWACCVNLLPIIMLKIQNGHVNAEPILVLWLFIKNWMFCTVNAIMFDMKDYADDANKELKTFVVRIGLRKTIFYVLIPLLVIGIISLAAFAWSRHFGIITFLFNLIPFICLLIVAYSLHRRKKILFYLIVIDGLLLVKALCGIAGAHFLIHRL